MLCLISEALAYRLSYNLLNENKKNYGQSLMVLKMPHTGNQQYKFDELGMKA